MNKFVQSRNQSGDMPPPSLPINTYGPNIVPAGHNSPRNKVLGSKLKLGRSIPSQVPVVSSPRQLPIEGVKEVIVKLGGVGEVRNGEPAMYQHQHQQNGEQRHGELQGRDVFDTDLDTTASDGSGETVNAVDENQTRYKRREQEDDEEGQYEDDEGGDGFVDEQGQYPQNGHLDQGHEDPDDEGESSGPGEEEEEDDEHMPMEQGRVNGSYNGQKHTKYQQTQQYAQQLQQRVFDDIPVRGGSPINSTSRAADGRGTNLQAASRSTNAAPQIQVQDQKQYDDGQDNFDASTRGDEDFESEGEVDEGGNQTLNGNGHVQNQPQYRNQGQQQQQYVQQQQQQHVVQKQKPRQPNPMHDPSGSTVAQRYAQAKGTGVSGAFDPSDYGDETTSIQEPVQQRRKAKAMEKRRASPQPMARKRAASPELDYEKPTLFTLPYAELAKQPFETKPPSVRQSTVVVKGKTLSERLEKAMQLPDDARMEFLNSLPLKDWDEAGGWLVSRFGAVMQKFVDLRRERRETIERFEKRLEERDAAVQRSVDKLKAEMDGMRQGGASILRGKSPGLF